jgi:hypothetical protein
MIDSFADRGKATAYSKCPLDRSLFFILLYTAFVQGLMFLYDMAHPNLFMHADRAADRMTAIEHLVSFFQGAVALQELLTYRGAALGVPGEYLIQGVIFYFGGQYAVIVFQILLFIASIGALYHLALLVTHSRGMSVAAALIYAHLPYGVVYPHMVWSESLFNPLVLISFYFVARSAIGQPNWPSISLAALFLGLATLVRPHTMLWAVVVVTVFWFCQVQVRRIAGYLAIFAVVLAIWPSFVWSQTGNFTLGNSSHVFRDLSIRLKKMIEVLPPGQQQAAVERYLPARASEDEVWSDLLSRYVSFAMTHPWLFIRTSAQEVFIFVTQSGIERFTIDYLELAGADRTVIQNPECGWRKKLAAEGFIATALMFMRDHGDILIASLIGAVAMLFLWGLAGLGAISAFAGRPVYLGAKERIMVLSMAVFPIYVFLPGQLFHYAPARYRTPAEFCLAVLAVIGWQAMVMVVNRPGARSLALHA